MSPTFKHIGNVNDLSAPRGCSRPSAQLNSVSNRTASAQPDSGFNRTVTANNNFEQSQIRSSTPTTPSQEAAAQNRSTRRCARWIVKSTCTGSRQSQSPDLSRDAGPSTDATATSATTVVNWRPAEQRQQHQRAREQSSQTVPTALLPLPEGPFPRHDLGSMTLQCPICLALHWEFEKSPTPGGATPFKLCCADGKVRLPGIEKPPPELLELLTGNGPVEKIFRDRILAFNESFVMASFGMSKGHGIISGAGPSSFYLSGTVFLRISTLAPGPADDPVFAQILFLAPTKHIEARRRFNGPPEEV
ncbi:BQ5605_C011g06449 [Microbotryum silenes-dioicae]|uniref:BQ5605_C011g06449 protein n=1 Tax=Microbotryum silenes-dioicae TaxID=796604 RepID=A0A2X0NT00_9BASI|nr:BQ5605_C011g06449 [Microbotryum silenes-dioicae]